MTTFFPIGIGMNSLPKVVIVAYLHISETRVDLFITNWLAITGLQKFYFSSFDPLRALFFPLTLTKRTIST